MTLFRCMKTAALAALAMTACAIVAAPPSPTEAIAARQTGFKRMSAGMKALKAQLDSNAPDTAAMVDAAQAIAAAARDQGKLFPPGSGPAAGIKTDALPNIWTDRATFDAQMAALVVQSGTLVTIAKGGDPTAIRAETRATGAVCGGCHRQFRADS